MATPGKKKPGTAAGVKPRLMADRDARKGIPMNTRKRIKALEKKVRVLRDALIELNEAHRSAAATVLCPSKGIHWHFSTERRCSMDRIESYVVTGIVLDIANSVRMASIKHMTDEEYAKNPVTIDDCLPRAVELFLARHSKIKTLLAEYREPTNQ